MRANDKQEGGDHYKLGTLRQHWDLVIDYDWDYFQAQVTKYLMRWKTKHDTFEKRLVDLKKALHFMEKYVENASKYDGRKDTILPAEQIRVMPRTQNEIDLEYWRQEAAAKIFQPDGFSGDGTNGYQCVKCRLVVRARSPLGALSAHYCAPVPTGTPTGAPGAAGQPRSALEKATLAPAAPMP